ncbi:hypothetical protein GQF56_15060 [Rhodobacter sphaeroides]|jgi:hypothetical protein|uniref:Heme exporter protein D n=3 Tax=Cereibacter TaxID=1653176 RepID=U5NMT8_CERS4|nr:MULTISPECIES: hypothetical protein [Cereibacter]ABN78619.1 hypothetical protein Rsph17029_3527 [Cereibacter sphaeroides ATCC 17029]EKX55679.1 hypothetical protein D516_4001 [Rhodobacter sp. AKP1]RDS93414.1 hypothetical protein DWF04_23355 [Cereibacter sphaeroides f. sp. denitrificans]ACM03020.1 Hypothetical Protein RSKD131_3160 [Cereibacter sphaeroides KD131]AGY32451.1 hypothetical protein RSP_7581 [Cereibacter sphaeroides 2.4.1]
MSYLFMESVLTFGTLGFVLALAYVNIRQTEKQLEESRKRRQGLEAAVAE